MGIITDFFQRIFTYYNPANIIQDYRDFPEENYEDPLEYLEGLDRAEYLMELEERLENGEVEYLDYYPPQYDEYQD